MNTKITIALALATGFIGGIASRYFQPSPAFAQATTSPQEIRAQKFVLVDGTRTHGRICQPWSEEPHPATEHTVSPPVFEDDTSITSIFVGRLKKELYRCRD